MKYYELYYRQNENYKWRFHGVYKTYTDACHAMNNRFENEIREIEVHGTPTQLERIERNINRLDIILLSLWFVAIFGIVYLITQIL